MNVGIDIEDADKLLDLSKLELSALPDETRAGFTRWKGIYETRLRRKQADTEQINWPFPAFPMTGWRQSMILSFFYYPNRKFRN